MHVGACLSLAQKNKGKNERMKKVTVSTENQHLQQQNFMQISNIYCVPCGKNLHKVSPA
jgi:hypothetical protein